MMKENREDLKLLSSYIDGELSPEEIEKKAGLTERYVQEWLGVMFDRNSSAGINLCASKY